MGTSCVSRRVCVCVSLRRPVRCRSSEAVFCRFAMHWHRWGSDRAREAWRCRCSRLGTAALEACRFGCEDVRTAVGACPIAWPHVAHRPSAATASASHWPTTTVPGAAAHWPTTTAAHWPTTTVPGAAAHWPAAVAAAAAHWPTAVPAVSPGGGTAAHVWVVRLVCTTPAQARLS